MQNFNFLNFFLMCHNSLSCTFGSEYCIVLRGHSGQLEGALTTPKDAF